jgi:peptidoglycan/xylan/chitin deacetylase (PgdA/CDA1 family)
MLFRVPYYLLRLRAVGELSRLCRAGRGLVLTYDDGPGRRLSRGLVELLGAHGARATFFLLGRRVVEDEETVDWVHGAGHELGVHSFDHRNAWQAPGDAAGDVEAGYAAAARWVAADGLFRPPHGKLSYGTWRALRRRGARICWWTVDSGDTWAELPPPERTVDAVLRAGGGVVLMHDFDRGPEREAFVLKTTELLLDAAAREGLTAMVMSELFSLRGGA